MCHVCVPNAKAAHFWYKSLPSFQQHQDNIVHVMHVALQQLPVFCWLQVLGLAALIQSKQISSVDLTKIFQQRLQR